MNSVTLQGESVLYSAPQACMYLEKKKKGVGAGASWETVQAPGREESPGPVTHHRGSQGED